ncbi:MAG: hypothetical protein IT372_34275 [Polyangiaceae bacterium]|nr:hypothetical protein [Polyangiaceae bacterium]
MAAGRRGEPSRKAGDRDELARALSDELGETDPEAVLRLRRLVRGLGWPACERALLDTREIEVNGGLWSVQERKRRTPGGVFFALMKSRSGVARAILSTQSAAQRRPPFAWEQRAEIIREALQRRGEAMTAKLMLMGRPAKVVERGDVVVTALEYRGAPSLPKGLPVPKQSSTVYTVYIAAKQWRKVADALKDPEDQLVVEGYCMIDPEAGCIALLAQSATTRALQRQKVAAAPRASAASSPEAPAAPAPAPPPPQPAQDPAEQVRSLLKQRLAAGQAMDAVAARAGLPLRALQDFHDARPTSWTPAQVQTILQKLRQALR